MVAGIIGAIAFVGFGVFSGWESALFLFVMIWMNNLRE